MSRLTPVLLALLASTSISTMAQQPGPQPSPESPQPSPGNVQRIGSGVSAPVVLVAPSPQYSEEAREKHISGSVLVNLQVDESGNPVHVKVLRGLGAGLDAKALEAVRAYHFRPAMKDGQPVTVEMNVEVHFQIYNKPPA